VFVFPSRTDTFGVVQLEALACGVPVAAYPVMGPRDVVGGSVVGVLDEDLRMACLGALKLSREACRDFALGRSWAASARQFITHVSRVAVHQPHGIPATTPGAGLHVAASIDDQNLPAKEAYRGRCH